MSGRQRLGMRLMFGALMGWDDTIRIWNAETWDIVAVIQRHVPRYRFRSLCFHPSLPRLAAAGARLAFYDIDLDALLSEQRRSKASHTVHYANAKVVLARRPPPRRTAMAETQ